MAYNQQCESRRRLRAGQSAPSPQPPPGAEPRQAIRSRPPRCVQPHRGVTPASALTPVLCCVVLCVGWVARPDADGQQPQYPQQAYYSGPPGGGDKGPQMYQAGGPQQGYYPPQMQQGPPYQGQQVSPPTLRTLVSARAEHPRKSPDLVYPPPPSRRCRPTRVPPTAAAQPMYYGQQPNMQPNVVVQQPRDSGPGCCTCCLACCAGALLCESSSFPPCISPSLASRAGGPVSACRCTMNQSLTRNSLCSDSPLSSAPLPLADCSRSLSERRPLQVFSGA